MLSVALVLSTATAAPGSTVTATVRANSTGSVAHHAAVALRAPGTSPNQIPLGDLGPAGHDSQTTIRIPATGATTVTVTATVTADQTAAQTAQATLVVTPPGNQAVPQLPYNAAALPWSQATALIRAPQVALPQVSVLTPSVAPRDIANMAAHSALVDGNGTLSPRTRFALLVGIQSGWLALLLLAGVSILARLRTARRRPGPASHDSSRRP